MSYMNIEAIIELNKIGDKEQEEAFKEFCEDLQKENSLFDYLNR